MANCPKKRLGSWSSSSSSANSVQCDPQTGASIGEEAPANQEISTVGGVGDARVVEVTSAGNETSTNTMLPSVIRSLETALTQELCSEDQVADKENSSQYNLMFKSLCSPQLEPVLFSGEYSVLSNHYLCQVAYKGEEFSSVEHAYQVLKARFHGKEKLADQIQHARRGRDAERLGSQVEESDLWISKRCRVIRKLLQSKSDLCPQFNMVLLDTGDHPLWHSVTCPGWGVGLTEEDFRRGRCPRGGNLLGVAIMKLRKSLRNTDSSKIVKDKTSHKKSHKKLKCSKSPKSLLRVSSADKDLGSSEMVERDSTVSERRSQGHLKNGQDDAEDTRTVLSGPFNGQRVDFGQSVADGERESISDGTRETSMDISAEKVDQELINTKSSNTSRSSTGSSSGNTSVSNSSSNTVGTDYNTSASNVSSSRDNSSIETPSSKTITLRKKKKKGKRKKTEKKHHGQGGLPPEPDVREVSYGSDSVRNTQLAAQIDQGSVRSGHQCQGLIVQKKSSGFGRGRVCFKMKTPGRRNSLEQQMHLQNLQEQQFQIRQRNQKQEKWGENQQQPHLTVHDCEIEQPQVQLQQETCAQVPGQHPQVKQKEGQSGQQKEQEHHRPTENPAKDWRQWGPKWGPRRGRKPLAQIRDGTLMESGSMKTSTPKPKTSTVLSLHQRLRAGEGGLGCLKREKSLQTSTPFKANSAPITQQNGDFLKDQTLETLPVDVVANPGQENCNGCEEFMHYQEGKAHGLQVNNNAEVEDRNHSVSDITLSRCNIGGGDNDGYDDSWLSNKDSSNSDQFNALTDHQEVLSPAWIPVNSRISPALKPTAPRSVICGSLGAAPNRSGYPHNKWTVVPKTDKVGGNSKRRVVPVQKAYSDTALIRSDSSTASKNVSYIQPVNNQSHDQSHDGLHDQSLDQSSDQLSTSSVDWFEVQDGPSRHIRFQNTSSSYRSVDGATSDSKLRYGSWEEYNENNGETSTEIKMTQGDGNDNSSSYNSWEEYNDKDSVPVRLSSVTPECMYREQDWRWGGGGRMSDPGPLKHQLMTMNNQGQVTFGSVGGAQTAAENSGSRKSWGRGRGEDAWRMPVGGWTATKSSSNLETAKTQSFGSSSSLNSEETGVWSKAFCKKFSSVDIPYIDTHCHIDFLFRRTGFKGTFAKYRSQNEATFPASYEGCVAVFCEPHSFKVQGGLWRDIVQEEGVWGAFGCHPKCATDYTLVSDQGLQACLRHPKTVALGEIGLDYSGKFGSLKEKQKLVFVKQLQMAMDRGLPLVIHCREAEDDCFEIMKTMVPKDWKIHRHCFTRDWQEASRWVAFFPNLFVGLTPLVTYSSAVEVHQVARCLPLDRLLLETDAPYFVPHGVRRDEMQYSHPGLAVVVADEVAMWKGVTTHEVLKACRENTRKMYGI
ncbi:uncharacterized protein LOC106173000 [Lingula anatina]|uniref:Uncharacterized protein LOC106173000 n=1 Tax=Lingula anatina TaxID=7574 RepID=A0A1S3JGC7_LINAN|nr:uncharacterized protein LOC106173000 [Lingula anatina]|eukprot:XP_013409413.1 uncharacterized protein LOC106173000 [Lingula anatina]